MYLLLYLESKSQQTEDLLNFLRLISLFSIKTEQFLFSKIDFLCDGMIHMLYY